MRSGGSAALLAAMLLAGCGGQQRVGRGVAPYRPVADLPVRIGPPYHIGGRTYAPADDPAYDAMGLASWYGKESGGRTANGERFRSDWIGAAHTTLPLPSYVEVTALATGRTILVRINDRGPFARDRLIDLSQEAARLLGTERMGTAAVRVRRVQPAEADRAALRTGRPAAPRPTVPPAVLASWRARLSAPASGGHTPRSKLYVDVVTVADAWLADALAQDVGGAVVRTGDAYHVRIGPVADDAAVQTIVARVRAAGYQDAGPVRDPASPPPLMDTAPR